VQRAFLLNAAFAIAKQFNLTYRSFIICYHTAQIVEIFHILWLFFIYHYLYMGLLPWDSHYCSFSHVHFHSIASSTRSSASVRIICPPILKSPNPSRASLVRYSLCKLNRIGDKQHFCLTLHPIVTLLLSTWYACTLTLIHAQFADQSSFLPVCTVRSRICIRLVQLTQLNAFYQTSK